MNATVEKEKLEEKKIHFMNDAMAKSIIRSKSLRNTISNFLSGITKISSDRIAESVFMGGEIPKRNMNEKGKNSDVIIQVANDTYIIVEINRSYDKHIFEKNASYAYSILLSKIKPRPLFYPKIVLVNIDAFNHFKRKEPLLKFESKDDETLEHGLYTSYHLILENITNTNYNIDEDVRKFGLLLKENLNIEELIEKYEGDEEYMKIIKKAKELMADDDFAMYYDIDEAHEVDKKDAYETGYDSGYGSGYDVGHDFGKREEKIAIAKNLLDLNYSIEDIMKATKLSQKEIMKLQFCEKR